ncbi:hypothetical protein HZA45_00920 [Candidatus Peregrinibacteria bacterium]|nr:hypothetical protein [Candidatus Peregrinibacteria bacterium]
MKYLRDTWGLPVDHEAFALDMSLTLVVTNLGSNCISVEAFHDGNIDVERKIVYGGNAHELFIGQERKQRVFEIKGERFSIMLYV